MIRLVISGLIGLLLASCTSATQKPFHRMSFQELSEYNSAVQLEKQVYCTQEVRAGSHIKKTYCSTIEEMVNGLDNSSRYLGTINYPTGR